MPADSATFVALGRVAPGWGTAEELLAVIAEVIDAGNRTFLLAHSKRGTPQPRPIQITRPAHLRPERRPATSDELREMFGTAARYTGSSVAPAGQVDASPSAELDASARDPHDASFQTSRATRRRSPANGSKRRASTADGSKGNR